MRVPPSPEQMEVSVLTPPKMCFKASMNETNPHLISEIIAVSAQVQLIHAHPTIKVFFS